MSMSVLLVPLAVALCVTASETIDAISDKCGNWGEESSRIQTRFNDADLLIQTLEEHGLTVSSIDMNHIFVSSSGGNIRYIRGNEGESFSIELLNVNSVDCLISDLRELEDEYGRNVQSFTYNKVLQSLPPEMSVLENTVLEDESILLTLSVEN